MMRDKDGWKLEKEIPNVGTVKSCYSEISKRKIYKLEALVAISPHKLWEDTVLELPNQPRWNPTLLEARVCITKKAKLKQSCVLVYTLYLCPRSVGWYVGQSLMPCAMDN